MFNPQPKQVNYRNRRLLNLAHRVTDCMFEFPTCQGHVAHGCEPIHSDHSEHGKGLGIKSADDMHGAGCHNCHLYYGDASNFKSRDEQKAKFMEARTKTFAYYRKFKWLGKTGYADK